MNFENIHISATNSTIQIGEHISYNQPAPTKVVEVEEAEVVEEPLSTEVSEKRCGRSRTILFAGSDGKEDTAVREREKAHILCYLREHKLSSSSLSAGKNDSLNRTVAGFVRYWKKNNMIAEDVGATAVYDFLNGDCGIPNAAEKKAVTNKWNMFFKDTDYGKEECRNIENPL